MLSARPRSPDGRGGKVIATALQIEDGCRGFNGYLGNARFADTGLLIGPNLSP